MWLLKVLTGPQAGQTFKLKIGTNLVGRSSSAVINLNHNGISKEHAVITVTEDKIIISDSNSRNGTYINGIKIQNRRYQPGAKISFHEITCEIIDADAFESALPASTPANTFAHSAPGFKQEEQLNFWQKAPQQLQTSVIDPLKNLTEKYEFQNILGLLVGALIFVTTFIAVLPHLEENKQNLHAVGNRTAITMAKQLAEYNRAPISTGQYSVLNTQFTQLQDGVKQAFIIDDKTGEILAPADMAGRTTDYAFVHRARKDNKEITADLENDTVGAAVPIVSYSLKLGANDVIAHAVVIYETHHLASSETQTFGLLIQSLFLTLLIGALFYVVVVKLLQAILQSVNTSIDQAVRENSGQISIKTQFLPLRELETNINSLLSQKTTMVQTHQPAFGFRKEMEAENLVNLVGFPALAVKHGSLVMIGMNQACEALLNTQFNRESSLSIDTLSDQALKLNIRDLIDKSQTQTTSIVTNPIDFQGDAYDLTLQVLFDAGEIAYYLVVVLPARALEEAG